MTTNRTKCWVCDSDAGDSIFALLVGVCYLLLLQSFFRKPLSPGLLSRMSDRMLSFAAPARVRSITRNSGKSIDQSMPHQIIGLDTHVTHHHVTWRHIHMQAISNNDFTTTSPLVFGPRCRACHVLQSILASTGKTASHRLIDISLVLL